MAPCANRDWHRPRRRKPRSARIARDRRLQRGARTGQKQKRGNAVSPETLLQSYFWLLSASISYPEQTATQLRAIWRDGLMAGGNAHYALLFQRSRAR